MKNYKSDHKRSGGGKGFGKFGGDGRRNQGGYQRNSNGPERHEAVCNTCGIDCMVPFRPNGRKAVLCSRCFKKDGPSPSERPSGDNYRAGSYEKRSYDKPREFNRDDRGVEEQLRKINKKLDDILWALDGEE